MAKQHIQDFSMFEASLRNNPGVPGAVNRNEPSYLTHAEQTAMEELRRRGIGRNAGPEMMRLIDQAMRLQDGHETALEELAERIIRNQYGDILDNVELNLTIVPMGQVMEQTPRSEDVLTRPPSKEEQEEKLERMPQPPPQQGQGQPQQRELTDAQIALEVHKRKMINNIIQGEGKNTHRLIHSPEVREELDNIEPGLFDVYDQILKSAEFLDWTMPAEAKLHMMENMPEGHGGFVSVDWKQAPDQEDFKGRSAEDILKDLEEGDSIEDHSEEIGDIFNAGQVPVINAIGVDFPMLIHETVKGIYELIASAVIPEDPHTAETVMMNTDTLADEIEDLRYGPFIAGDLRDFINENPVSDQYSNLREHVFGMMIQLDAEEFLELVKGILLKTPVARRKVDDMISEIAATLRDQQLEIGFGGSEDEYKEEDSDVAEPEAPKKKQAEPVANDEEKEIDYSKMRKADLQKLLDDALDAGDYELAGKIGKHIK